MTIREVKSLHELAVAKDFAKYISTDSHKYTVDERPDPPDAILISKTGSPLWIEITDVFRSEEEARDVYSNASNGDYQRPLGIIINPDNQISFSTIRGIERKLNKESYENALSKYGKGILILWIYDPLFSHITLRTIKSKFEMIKISGEYFKQVFIHWPNVLDRKFERIL